MRVQVGSASANSSGSSNTRTEIVLRAVSPPPMSPTHTRSSATAMSSQSSFVAPSKVRTAAVEPSGSTANTSGGLPMSFSV
jgi:hypothetical protein